MKTASYRRRNSPAPDSPHDERPNGAASSAPLEVLSSSLQPCEHGGCKLGQARLDTVDRLLEIVGTKLDRHDVCSGHDEQVHRSRGSQLVVVQVGPIADTGN